jgi:hypothetical protein
MSLDSIKQDGTAHPMIRRKSLIDIERDKRNLKRRNSRVAEREGLGLLEIFP